MDKDLIVQIIVDNGNETVPCGTAYPVAPSRLITAAHVIKGARAEQIKVRWYYQRRSHGKWRPCKKIVKRFLKHDVAIVEVDFPDVVKDRFGTLFDVEPDTDDRWESEGFPLAGIQDDKSEPVPLKGAIYRMAKGAKSFQLGVDDPTNLRDGWKGASGSPVFARGKIIGIIVECPANFAYGKLKAVPVCRLLEDPAFRQAVRYPETDQSHQTQAILTKAAVDLLSTSKKALEAMSKQLSVNPLLDQDKWSDAVVEKLLGLSSTPLMLNEMVIVIANLDKQKSKDSADVIEKLAYFLIPASLNKSHVRRLTLIMTSGTENFEFQAKTKTFVEIAMARINVRPIELRGIKKASDTPSGRLCLVDPPEQGMDDDHDGFIQAFVDELSKIVPSDFVSTNKNPSAARTENVAAINVELETLFEVQGWQRYYVFKYPENDVERRRRNEVARKLDQMFPRIAFIGLDREHAPNDEQEILSRMRLILCRAANIENPLYGQN